MYPSTYLSWFRRLLILGAVVAGLTASAAGARLDPGTPPDVSDVASALPASQATIVSRPPDVQDAALSVNAAIPDVFERYAAEHPYGSEPSSSGLVSSPPDVQDAMAALHSTPAGLKADGLRWQGIARVYEHQLHSPMAQNTTPAGLKADGLRMQGIARVYDSLLAASAVSPTESAPSPAYSLGPALLQYQQGTGFFARPKPTVSAQGPAFSLGTALVDYQRGTGFYAKPKPTPVSTGFAWDDWGIGIGTGLGLALLLGVGIIIGRQQRHRMQPA